MTVYILFNDKSFAVKATNDHEEAKQAPSYITRHDVEDMDMAEKLAAQINVYGDGQGSAVAVDNGRGCWPRYEVTMAPAVGDPVSRSFNGDYYPCGHVVSVSPTKKKIVTSNGTTFIRRKQTGGWKEAKGCFWLVEGHHKELNPHF